MGSPVCCFIIQSPPDNIIFPDKKEIIPSIAEVEWSDQHIRSPCFAVDPAWHFFATAGNGDRFCVRIAWNQSGCGKNRTGNLTGAGCHKTICQKAANKYKNAGKYEYPCEYNIILQGEFTHFLT